MPPGIAAAQRGSPESVPQQRFDCERDRGFESRSLQRGVCEPSVPLGFRDCRRGSIRRAARPAYLDSADLRVDPKGLLFRTRNGPGGSGWLVKNAATSLHQCYQSDGPKMLTLLS